MYTDFFVVKIILYSLDAVNVLVVFKVTCK